jgi:flagellar motor switch protein FliN
MSDILSQDQIDSLLSQQALDGQDAGALIPEASTTEAKDYNALEQAFEPFKDQAGAVLSTLINKTVTLELVSAAKADAGVLIGALPGPSLSVAVPLKGAVSGPLFLLMPCKAAAMLSDLMMMGDGSAEYTEEHKDAVSEIINQVMGAYGTALGGSVGGSVSAGPISVADYEQTKPPVLLDAADLVLFKVRVKDVAETDLVVLVSPEASNQLMARFGQSAHAAAQSGEMDAGVGLNRSELEDLSKVTDDLSGDAGGGFQPTTYAPSSATKENVDMLLDVELDVSIELGKSNLSIKRILELAPGSIVELDRMAGEPVDLLVNNKVVAKGEVVVVDESFGIRILSLVSPEERIKSLR